jgi:branched-chain amino acid transport system ATP-binding protein
MSATTLDKSDDEKVYRSAMEQEQPVLLRADELHKSFGGQAVLDGISVELRRGEVVLLRGANGSGKTTLLNILTGNLEPETGTIHLSTDWTEETLRFPRTLWQELNPFNSFTPERVARAGVGRTWQDIRLFSTQSLRDNIAAAAPDQLGENPVWTLLRRPAMCREERQHRKAAIDSLENLGLAGRDTSSADKISLGQAKRVSIARAVHAGARVLLLDEPLAGLDESGISGVMQLLKRLVRESGLTLVLVEHVLNIPYVLELASKVWTLEEGRLTVEDPEEAPRSVERSQHEDFQTWIRTLACPDGEITNQSLAGGAVLSTFASTNAQSNEVVLDIEDLVVYRNRRLVIGEETENGTVQGITFIVRRGQVAVLQAPNGWGKTTLLEVIAGMLSAARGTIRLKGQPVQDVPAWERDVSLLQARDHSFPTLTVQEALQLAKVDPTPAYVKPLVNKRVADLSGGERQKVALACTIGGATHSLNMLDEPFSALDASSLRHLKGSLDAHNKALLFAVPSTLN